MPLATSFCRTCGEESVGPVVRNAAGGLDVACCRCSAHEGLAGQLGTGGGASATSRALLVVLDVPTGRAGDEAPEAVVDLVASEVAATG